jgi:hypothetical protein
MLGLLVTLVGLFVLLAIGSVVFWIFVEVPEVRRAFVVLVGYGVAFVLLALMPGLWGVWTFFVLSACGMMTVMVAAGLEYFRAARRVSVGRGPWRLIAWGQLRLSRRVHMVLAMAIALGLTLGGWEVLRRG